VTREDTNPDDGIVTTLTALELSASPDPFIGRLPVADGDVLYYFTPGPVDEPTRAVITGLIEFAYRTRGARIAVLVRGGNDVELFASDHEARPMPMPAGARLGAFADLSASLRRVRGPVGLTSRS
jgi:hypothetical protein